MSDIEHPAVTQTLRTGYPKSTESGHWGIDACGNEILHGDVIYEFPNGEIVLMEKVEQFLKQHLGAVIKVAN